MPTDEHYRRLERMYAAAPTNEYYRPTLRISDGATELEIPIRADFHHALDAVHGSVYFKALDDAAFFAVASRIDDVFALTVSFNLYITRPISEGVMRARGRVVDRSGPYFVAEAVLTDGEGTEIARGSGMFARSSRALTEAEHYR